MPKYVVTVEIEFSGGYQTEVEVEATNMGEAMRLAERRAAAEVDLLNDGDAVGIDAHSIVAQVVPSPMEEDTCVAGPGQLGLDGSIVH